MASSEQEIVSDMIALRDAFRAKADKLDAAITALTGSDLEVQHSAPSGVRPRPIIMAAMGGIPKGSQTVTRYRELGDNSLKILTFIGERGDVEMPDIQKFAEGQGLFNYDGLRSRLSDFTNKKYLQRVKKGVYRLTDTGAAKCGINLGNDHRGEDVGASSPSHRQHVSVAAEHAGQSGEPPAQSGVLSLTSERRYGHG
jgi:hypothetical protein